MSPLRDEVRALRRLALPIVLTSLGTMLMGVVDTAMVGHMNDATALAAAALANVWIHGTSMFAMGLVYGIDPLVTQAHGARDRRRSGLALQWGLVVAAGGGLLAAGLWAATGDFLHLAQALFPSRGEGGGMGAETSARAHDYARVQVWSAVPFLAFVALRQHLQGRGIVRPALFVIVVTNVFNVIANRLLIFGGLGFPALGLEGAGIASAWARMVMLALLAGVVWRYRLLRGGWVPWTREAIAPRGVGAVLRYGLPTAFQMGLEVWAFGMATLMAGELGDAEASAHVIVLHMAATSFMVPLGVSSAAATRVGNLLGSGRPERAQAAAWVALGMGAGAMAVAALFFLATGTLVPSLFLDDPRDPSVQGVLHLCGVILPIAATFQVFDGAQVVGCGILRGMGRTLPAAVINLVGYWILALPIGYWATFHLGLGLRGVWWGLALALALVAVGLVVFVRVAGPARAKAIYSSAAASPARSAGQTDSPSSERGSSTVRMGVSRSRPSSEPREPGVG